MKKILCQFQKNLVLGLTIIGCLGVYPATLIPSPIAFSESSESGSGAENGDSNTPLEPGESEDPSQPKPDPENPDDLDDPDGPDEPEELYDFDSDLIIYAINPGYTKTTSTGKLSDVGEFIELLNLTDAPLALAGYSIIYTNSSGNDSLVFTFQEDSYMTGKHLLLRYAKSPESESADLTYSKTLALKGSLRLSYDEEVVDQVCWTGKADCESAFSSSKPKLLQRDLSDGTFASLNIEEYEPDFDPSEIRLVLPPEPDPDNEDDPEEEAKLAPHCQGLEFSELLTYYVDDKSEQFIEFFNPTAEDIILDGCKIGFKSKTYELSGTINSGTYLAYYQSDQFSLTKNPKNPLILTLIDSDGSVIDEIAYPNGQKKSTSYARIYDAEGKETWQITYAPSPNAENVYQKFRSCEEGKVINEATGNCVKVTTLKSATSTLKSSSSTLAPCPEGKYRNPLTGRCKKIETASSTLKECAEGYERNPETNRCRKITKPNDGADYALVPDTSTNSHTVFIGIGIVLLIISIGLTYVVLQFRHEISRAARKASQRLNHIRQDLFARTIGRHRNKKP